MSENLRHPGMFSPGFRYVLKLERQTDGRKTEIGNVGSLSLNLLVLLQSRQV
jgi:hypothetical protein